MLVVYEATGNAYLFASDGVPTLLSTTDYARLSNLPSINGVTVVDDVTLEELGIAQLVSDESNERKVADSILQEQIDAIAISSGVVDVVGTYEELEEYDTSKLKGGEIVKVLADETIGGSTAYYRWENGTWNYIGEEGPYYTKNETDALLDQKLDVDAFDDALDNYYDKAETDALLADKADAADLTTKQDKLVAGSNITIDQATNVISATVPSLDNYYTKQETYSQSEVDGLVSGVEGDIPTATSQLTNDSGFLTNIPTASASTLGAVKVGSGLSITQDGTLSADTQNIDVDTALSATSTNPVENRVITSALNGKANTSDIPTVPSNVSAFYNDAGYITNTTLAQNYYNKTETYTKTEVDGLIPTVNNATLTVQRNSTSVGTFTANASSNKTINIAVPTATSDLTNDSGFLTGTDYATASAGGVIKVGGGLEITNGVLSATGGGTADAVEWANVLNRPTDVSYWTNDAGYITSADLPAIPSKTSDLTNDGSDGTSTYVESSELGDYVTLTTNQNITGEKTFVGNKRIKFKGTASNSKLGFTAYDQNNGENGFLEVEGASTASKKVRLGCYDQNSGGNARDNYVGFQYYNTKPVGGGTVSYNLVCPPRYKGISGTNSYAYIPIDFTTNGTDKVSADTSGIVNISSIVPSKTSDLINDSGFITGYTETDPIYSASPAAGITAEDIESWDNKSDFSGSYNDLTDKPTIPTVNNATLTIQKNGTNVQTFTANQSTNATANITVPTQTSELTNNSGFLTSSTGVTSVNGAHGAVTGIQTTSNLVTSVTSSSTNSQYPSAKLFYDTVGNVESVLQTLNNGTGV